MKKADICNIIYIVIFFAVCTAPLLLWGFLKNEQPIGNTELAKYPSLTTSEGSVNTEYFSQFSDYFTDHFPLRAQLVTADNYIKSQLLGGNAANVITGKNGYIFSAETAGDYVGVTLSDRAISNIARTAALMQQKTESSGGSFVLAVIPNKNTVCYEYMPSRYIKSDVNNLTLLEDQLSAMGVNYADVKSVLLSVNEELYLKRDTHWNGLGALYGFSVIMDSLGKEYESYSGLDYTYTKDWRGDLDKLLYPSGGGVTEYQYYFDCDSESVMFLSPYLNMDNEAVLKELMSDSEKHDTLIKTKNPAASGQLLMLRDSFSRAMLPFLITSYGSTTITRSQPFSMTSLSEGTDVIYEIAERNLSKITDSAPIMEAIICDAPEITSIDKSEKNSISVDKTQSFVRIYGILDKKYFDCDSRIFITCTSDIGSYTYEAFPICEKELLSLESSSDYGYSLILPNNIPAGTYEISAVITSKNANTSTDILTQTVIES